LLIEAAVEHDADGGSFEGTDSTLKLCAHWIRKSCLSLSFVLPVPGGSAFKKQRAFSRCLHVVDYPPSPLDVVDYMGFKPGDETETRNIPRRADDDMALALRLRS
jgi:elongation factor G